MFLQLLCPPAFIYFCFALTHIIIDLFNNLYNTAMFKFIVMIVYTIALQVLCDRGLSIISWFLVFIPFVLMSVIISFLLYVFGYSAATGKMKHDKDSNY